MKRDEQRDQLASIAARSRTDAPLDPLETIAARARMESAPSVDVTATVLRRLRVASAAENAERPMLWLAAGALAVAAIVMVFAMPYLSGTLDPLTEFLAEADTTVI